MNKAAAVNLTASVSQRLLNISRERGEDYTLTLTHYAVERFLYRLSQSQYVDDFVLKGAMLYSLWTARVYRPTRDLDLLGYGDSSLAGTAARMREVCQVPVPDDGLAFDRESVRVTEIREEQEYGGVRVQLTALLGRTRIPLQVDVGFGDVVTPKADEIDYPTLLDYPAPRLRAYTKDTVVAEKLQAMVALGIANSRMKDFYDLWTMSREFAFDGQTLADAIRNTFGRRSTPIPTERPLALSKEFGHSPDKSTQWIAFLRRSGLEKGSLSLADVINLLSNFLLPPMFAAAQEREFGRTWPSGGPWSEE